MVSLATFGPGQPGSNPGWFAASNSVINTQKIKASD